MDDACTHKYGLRVSLLFAPHVVLRPTFSSNFNRSRTRPGMRISRFRLANVLSREQMMRCRSAAARVSTKGQFAMRRLTQMFSLTVFAVTLSACASSPEDIKAASIDPTQFDYMTCAQLAQYSAGLNATYKLAADQESDARSEDVIGYIVLQQPLGQQRHAAIPAEIADLKGRLAALQVLKSSKNCDQQQASLSPASPANASQ